MFFVVAANNVYGVAGFVTLLVVTMIVFAGFYGLVWGIDRVRLGFKNDNRYERWVSIGLAKCTRCDHAKRDHADMRTLSVSKCGRCTCNDFAEC